MDDALAVRVRGQPALAGAHQLVDLVVPDPVVLVRVQDREQDVQVTERVGEPERAGQVQVHVPGAAPARDLGIELDRRRLDVPAQRAEHLLRDHRTPAARDGRRMDLQRDRTAREFRPGLAPSRDRGAIDPAERDGEHRRGGVRPVVDVLRQAEPRPLILGLAAHQGDRVHLEQQRRGAPLLGRLGIEDVCRAHGQLERLHLAGVLVQQEAEIRRRRRGRGHGEQHVAIVSSGGRATSPNSVLQPLPLPCAADDAMVRVDSAQGVVIHGRYPRLRPVPCVSRCEVVVAPEDAAEE